MTEAQPARERLVSVAPRVRSFARQNHSSIAVGNALRDARDRRGVTRGEPEVPAGGLVRWGRHAPARPQGTGDAADDSCGAACSGAGLHGLRPRSHAVSPCGHLRCGREIRPCAPSNDRVRNAGPAPAGAGPATYVPEISYRGAASPELHQALWRRATPCARPPAPSCGLRSPSRRCGPERPRSGRAWP